MEKAVLVNNFVTVNDKNYYDCKVFAELTGRSEQAVRLLILKGNRFRKLKATKLGQTILVDKEELVDFPFSCPGRSKVVVHYDEKGNELLTSII